MSLPKPETSSQVQNIKQIKEEFGTDASDRMLNSGLLILFSGRDELRKKKKPEKSSFLHLVLA